MANGRTPVSLGQHDYIRVQDEAPAELAPDRSDLPIFLIDQLGRPLNGVSILAQYYPGNRMFRHRRGKLDQHGFARLSNLPARAVVDLMLRDPSELQDGKRVFVTSAKKRILIERLGGEPLVWRIPSGSIDVTVGGIGPIDENVLTLYRKENVDVDSSDGTESEKRVLARRRRDGDHSIKVLGLENGSYRVSITNLADEELWGGEATVQMQHVRAIEAAQRR